MFLDKIPVRVRLSLGHAIWMAIVFVSIGVGVYRVVEDSIFQSFDTTLLTSAKAIRDVQYSRKTRNAQERMAAQWESLLNDFFGNQPASIRAHAQLVDMSGKVQASNGDLRIRLPVTPQAVARAEKGLETFENFKLQGDVLLRQLTLPLMVNKRFTGELIQVGAPLTGAKDTLKSVRRMLTLSLLLALAMSIFFGYLLTKWSLRPVVRISRTVSTIGVSEDFDKRLKLPPAKDELQQLANTFNEMLTRIEDAFGRLRKFTGNVSHELRTPLAVLRGEAELALRRERSADEYKNSLKAIVRESSHMSSIVEDLLLLARAQGKSIELRKEMLPISVFLSELKHLVEASFLSKNVYFSVSCDYDDQIYVAKNYLHLALKNILLNACKHSSEGSRVDLNVKVSFGETQFAIRDYGEGISESAIPYIFDTFYRADTARNRDSGGAGIGLSLAKALIELHGGSLKVSSQVGQGATFTATLPNYS